MMVSESLSTVRWAVRVYDGLGQLPPSYARLFELAAARSVFLSLPWLRNYERHVLGERARARVYGVESAGAGAPPAAALLTQPAGGSLPWSGRRLCSLGNYYTALYEPIVEPDCSESRLAEVLGALAGKLAAESPVWDTLLFQPLDLEQPACRLLERLLQQAGFFVDRFFCFGNWYLEVGGLSYAQYFAQRPKRLSQNAPRSRRRLEASGRMRFEIVSSRRDLHSAKAAYRTIYGASWKQSESFPEFIDGLLDTAADHGWLRLGIIHIDGIPAAAQIWLVVGGTASIFKMAYDARFTRESVGTVLSSYLMEHVIDVDKVSVVDYLSGDDDYKRDWMSHRRERWGLIALNPRSVRGLGAAARHFGGRTLRRIFPAPAPDAGTKPDLRINP